MMRSDSLCSRVFTSTPSHTSREQHHVDASTASVCIIIMHRHTDNTDMSSYTAYLRPFFLSPFITSVFANGIFLIRRQSSPGQ